MMMILQLSLSDSEYESSRQMAISSALMGVMLVSLMHDCLITLWSFHITVTEVVVLVFLTLLSLMIVVAYG